MTLPGGFVLPVCLVEESWIPYNLTEVQYESAEANAHPSNYAAAYLSEQMIAGQILHSEESFVERDAVYLTEGKYACLEMIGQERKEEIYGKHQ